MQGRTVQPLERVIDPVYVCSRSIIVDGFGSFFGGDVCLRDT